MVLDRTRVGSLSDTRPCTRQGCPRSVSRLTYPSSTPKTLWSEFHLPLIITEGKRRNGSSWYSSCHKTSHMRGIIYDRSLIYRREGSRLDLMVIIDPSMMILSEAVAPFHFNSTMHLIYGEVYRIGISDMGAFK